MDNDQKHLRQMWELGLRAARWWGSHYESVLEDAASEHGLTSPSWYAWLLPALAFEPEAVSTEKLRVRSPYAAPRLYEERLANAAAAGYLRCVDGEGYMLTLKGHEAAQSVLQAGDACMAQLSPLPPERMEELARLLRVLVDACLSAPEPPGHWGIAHSRKFDRGDNAPAAVRIDQYLSDLAAYRDDCHLAAWAPLGIDGPAHEVLTYLWRAKDPLSLEELYDALKQRGWEPSDYRARLAGMMRRGWVEQAAQSYAATLTGWAIRQDVEQKTDEYFFRPWIFLSAGELQSLSDLLKALDNSNMTKG